YEAEMAFVIGKAGKRISRERALEHLAGYTILNDVSAREWQRRTSQWILGKTSDTFCPLGPCLAMSDEVPTRGAMGLKLSIGGELLQQSNTAQMVFGVEDIVEYLSAVFTLEPGDVVATGTPGGVGSVRKPPRWLRPGDVVRIELQGVGVLENPVKASR
ncbi:MAG: fumarylacetoacetate hydrolase family protein, partial [bacterium]